MEPVTRIKSKTPVPYELTAIHHNTHDTKTSALPCLTMPRWTCCQAIIYIVHATIDGKPGETALHAVVGARHHGGLRLDGQAVRDRRVSKISMTGIPETRVLMRGRILVAIGWTAWRSRWALWRANGHHPDDFHHSLDSRPGSRGQLFLVFANKAETDIIFRDEWDEDAREHANFHCYHAWSSRLEVGRKARAVSLKACCASICRRPVLTR